MKHFLRLSEFNEYKLCDHITIGAEDTSDMSCEYEESSFVICNQCGEKHEITYAIN